MKHSSKIALAIATSAPAIKAEEMCGSESSEKQPKKKEKKKKRQGKRKWRESSDCCDCPNAREGDRGSPGLGAARVKGKERYNQ